MTNREIQGDTMTTGTDQNTSISCGIDVGVPPSSAFAVFTAGFDRWWNRDHHLLKAELKQAVIEEDVGGRVYEESVDGEICEWGEVLAWDPPRQFAFSWRIGTDWGVPTKDAPYSVVTVSFTATDAGTHVDLVHSGLDAHGDGWQKIRDSVGQDNGWPGLLDLFTAEAAKATA
jgi:uncharacterized protein YndB with AHSA1/START domain